jgi:hypothetical protein
MPTYLYCVLSNAVEPRAGLAGIDGGTVRGLDARGLHAWVSDVDGSVSPTVDRVKAHDAVCASALEASDTPLPIRFGQLFPDDEAVVDAVISRERTLRSRLDRVVGCVELRVVVTRGRSPSDPVDNVVAKTDESAVDPSGEPFTGPGTAFLERLARAGRNDLAREVGCDEIRHAVRSMGRPLVVDHQPCESARGVSFFPVLVRRADVSTFAAAIADITARDGIDLSVLGPFAPYSFAGDG